MAKGYKTGGRKKGTPNKATAARAAAIAASGVTPLDYALSVMRDENADPHARLEAAKAALPFCHPRLAPVDSTRKPDDYVPLAERLKAYARRDAIEAAHGNAHNFERLPAVSHTLAARAREVCPNEFD